MGVRMGRVSRAAMRRFFRGTPAGSLPLDPGIWSGVEEGIRMRGSTTWQQLNGATWQPRREGGAKSVTWRHMSGPPKEPFDPLKKPPSTPTPPSPSPSPSSLPGNSFIFVSSQRENVFGRTWRKVESVGKSLSSLSLPPLVPLVLGLGGAIPFVALAPPVSSYVPLPAALRGREGEAQAAYGACILSFLGGPHWGLAMASHGASPGHAVTNFTVSAARYGWSVIPALLAWPSLLLPPTQKFALLISSFALTLGVDSGFSSHKLVPKWYLPLRVLLTSAAIVSMTSSLSVALTKPNSITMSKTTNSSREQKK